MHLFSYLLIFLIGILIGSFLNVCIYRIPLERTIVKGRSYCPNCNQLIPWYCNIPIISYLVLRGKCKYCKVSISPIYPVVELLNGILYLAVFYIYGFSSVSILLSLLISALIVISFIDAEYQIIPDGLIIFILVLAITHVLVQTIYYHQPWYGYGIGFFAASLPLFILGLIYEDGIGGGDIKLMAVTGLFLGWKLILLGLFSGNLIAFFYVGIRYFQGKARKGTAISFGPFLSLGIVSSILFGTQILDWYVNVFF